MLSQTFHQVLLVAVCGALTLAQAQDSNYGFSLPVTLSGGAMYTGRLQLKNANNSPVTGGTRFLLYPTLTLGPHWFAYAATQIRLLPYFYYDAYDSKHEWYVETLQAFLGYQIRGENSLIVFKAGRLSSAFGAFPLHYDDADNPLLDQPLSYIQTLAFRNDQLPCGVADLLRQHYGYVSNRCGGQPGGGRGLTPVSLYGSPGVQVEASTHGMDARVQITSGSPSNALSLSHAPEYAQWAGGAGYTIRQGFRVGVSGFRGPYLSPALMPLLPSGTSVRDFPATGLGLDIQWVRGDWRLSGESQHFRYDSPAFTQAPSIVSTYAEARRILTPRFYAAARTGWLKPGGAADASGGSIKHFSPALASYELGGGWWLNRHQLLKASYEWLRIENLPGTQTNVLGLQFVTNFHAVDQPFR